MKKREAERLAGTLIAAKDQLMRDYILTLPGIKREQIEKYESWRATNTTNELKATTDVLQELPLIPPIEVKTRAERIRAESRARRAFLKGIKKLLFRPRAGGRPLKLKRSEVATLISRTSYLLGQGMDRRTAFGEVARLLDTSPSTVRRRWKEYEKSSIRRQEPKKRGQRLT